VTQTLSVESVGKRFGDLHALRDVSFDANAGEVIGVVGANGAGKTTLLSIIAGAQQPSSGCVRGPAMHNGRRIGWVPQQPAVYSKLSVAENLRLFAHLEGIAKPEPAVSRMLEQVGLQGRARELVEHLSGGNRQRVNVAVGLIADPPVLVLDEPSAALDPGQRERLWQFIGERAGDGTSVVFSTHMLHEAQLFANRVIVLDRGELLFDGPPLELIREAARGGGDGGGDRGVGPGGHGRDGADGGVGPGGHGRDGADLEHALVAFLEARGR
jgi:ABC-2 type transport system ATP-binding protein